MGRKFRLAVLNSHPIQYFTPLYRRLAQEPQIDLMVYYCHRQGAETYVDPGFGVAVQWDTPLLEGYNYRFLPNWRRAEQVGGFFSLMNGSVIGALRQDRPDALLVHGHMYFSYLLGILAANILRIPVFMRCETHLRLPRSRFKSVLRQPLLRLLYGRLCARCLPIGSRNREFYRALGIPEAKLFTVPYTVDNDYFMRAVARYQPERAQLKAAWGLPPDAPVILFSAKFTPRKRPLDLLRAYAQLRSKGIPAALLLVGSGELASEMEVLVAQAKIPDVHFCGFQNQSELPKFYAAADIFVLPSENEPWGLVINEVMCAALPVIASEEIGATADLVYHGDNGFLFRAGDIDQLTHYLQILATDELLRRTMGSRSLEIIAAWNFDKDVSGLLNALASLN